MLIGILSDTHDNLALAERAARILMDRGVDMVVHLGDIVSPFTLRRLASLLDVEMKGIFGNNDGDKLLLYKIAAERGWSLEEQPRILELQDRRILLLHGFGAAEKTRSIVDALALSGFFDAILYGHTHSPDLRRLNGTLILNPGAASGYLAEKPSVAVLDISDMRAEIIYI